MNDFERRTLKEELLAEIAAEQEARREAVRAKRARMLRVGSLVSLGLATVALAVTIPNVFSANTPISASQINANFTALNNGKQERVTGTCSTPANGTTTASTTNEAVVGINADGSVRCATVFDPRFGSTAQGSNRPPVGPQDATTPSLKSSGGDVAVRPQATGDACYYGEVWLFAGNFAPRGTLFAHGQLLSIAQNTALFSLLGTMYGGNGQTTFALPDLRGLEPRGVNYVICTEGIYPSRP